LPHKITLPYLIEEGICDSIVRTIRSVNKILKILFSCDGLIQKAKLNLPIFWRLNYQPFD